MDATTTADKPIKKRRQADGRAPTPEEAEEEMRPTLAAPEEEVEEFFAILRRIHVAVKYFERSGAEAGGIVSGKRWRPAFEKEDFVGIDGAGGDDGEVVVGDCGGGNYKEAGSEVGGPGLDLNLDPPSDLASDHHQAS